MQKGFYKLFCIIFLLFAAYGGGNGVNEVAKMKYLTLPMRRELAKRWGQGDSAAEIARDFGVSNATIYTEIKRGDDGTLDENMRPHYDAELGQKAFQEALRNRGRRPAVTTD